MEFTATPDRRETEALAGATRPAGRKAVRPMTDASVLLIITLLLVLRMQR